MSDHDASRTESALIGTLLVNPSACDHCGDLHPLDFVDRELGRAYELIRMARASGRAAGGLGRRRGAGADVNGLRDER